MIYPTIKPTKIFYEAIMPICTTIKNYLKTNSFQMTNHCLPYSKHCGLSETFRKICERDKFDSVRRSFGKKKVQTHAHEHTLFASDSVASNYCFSLISVEEPKWLSSLWFGLSGVYRLHTIYWKNY